MPKIGDQLLLFLMLNFLEFSVSNKKQKQKKKKKKKKKERKIYREIRQTSYTNPTFVS